MKIYDDARIGCLSLREYVLTRTTCVLAMLAACIRDNYHALIMLVGLEEKEKPDKNHLL